MIPNIFGKKDDTERDKNWPETSNQTNQYTHVGDGLGAPLRHGKSTRLGERR